VMTASIRAAIIAGMSWLDVYCSVRIIVTRLYIGYYP
jgi:hypothetical protein